MYEHVQLMYSSILHEGGTTKNREPYQSLGCGMGERFSICDGGWMDRKMWDERESAEVGRGMEAAWADTSSGVGRESDGNGSFSGRTVDMRTQKIKIARASGNLGAGMMNRRVRETGSVPVSSRPLSTFPTFTASKPIHCRVSGRCLVVLLICYDHTKHGRAVR